MTKDADLSHLLNQEIEQNQKQLHKILAGMAGSLWSKDILKQGLVAAHTLKALAAVKGVPHLEEYAAQLEQLFLKAQSLDTPDVEQRLMPSLNAVEREFKTTCNWLAQQQETSQSSPPRKLTKLVEQLFHLDKQQSQTRFEGHLKALKTTEISVEALFRSFSPWLHQAAQASSKRLVIEVDVPEPVTLHIKHTGPLQTILVHLLRNALFHGIELPEERNARGKSQKGVIQLSAEVNREESMLVITISDDGKGVSSEKDESHTMISALTSVFQVTAPSITENAAVETSIFAVNNAQTGLGVGLHIVESHVGNLEGTFELKSIAGVGTSAIVKLPYHGDRQES